MHFLIALRDRTIEFIPREREFRLGYELMSLFRSALIGIFPRAPQNFYFDPEPINNIVTDSFLAVQISLQRLVTRFNSPAVCFGGVIKN